MELTSKQRSHLRGMASTINPIFQIGKASLTPEIISAIDDAIEKRELIKISVLGEIIAERTHAQVVAVTGKKIVLYRKSKKHPKIELF